MAMFWRLAPPKHGEDAPTPSPQTAYEHASELSNPDTNIDANGNPAAHQPTTPPAAPMRPQHPAPPSIPSHSNARDDDDLHPAPHTYVVTTSHLVRSGAGAAVEEPAIREEVVSVCFSANRAREIARRVWRERFGGGIPVGKVEEWDGIGFEGFFFPGPVGLGGSRGGDDGGGDGGGQSEGGLELFRLANRAFVDAEDGCEVLAGERRVRVWRVGVDGLPGAVGEGDRARTPESE